MGRSDRWTRGAALTGVVFVALTVISIVASGNTPGADKSGAEAITFFKDHKNAEIASAIVGAYGILFFVFFAAVLRDRLRHAGSDALATAGFGGAIFLAVGGAIFSGLTFALADQAGTLPPAAAQALNVLSNDFFFPSAIGAAAFLILNGIAVLRTRLVPVWLGYPAIVVGVVALTPIGFFAFLVLMLWVLILSVWLYVRPAA